MATVRISTSLLHRLDACVPERRRWRELFGDGLVEVNEVVADVVIRAPLNLAWFLSKTCGQKTLRAICEEYRAGVLAEWLATGPPEEWRFHVEAGNWPVANIYPRFGEGDAEYSARLLSGRAALYLANTTRALRLSGYAMVGVASSIHHAAHLLSYGGLREVPLAAAALTGAINGHSRVINRSIALAGIK